MPYTIVSSRSFKLHSCRLPSCLACRLRYMPKTALHIFFFGGLLFLGACAGGTGGDTNPWKMEDYRRPAEGAPNRLSKSSLSDPDLFYAGRNYSVQKLEKQGIDRRDIGQDSDTNNRDRSNIPYERFQQTLENFSRQQQSDGQQAMEDRKKKDSFLGAKLPDDPGVAPGISRQRTENASAYGKAESPARPDKIRAALLVPLTGEHRSMGEALLRAAETSMFNLGANDFVLLPRDTQGTRQGARQAAEKAISDGADVILGPLFASSTRAVKSVARRNDLKVFSFTTDWTVADDTIFAMGFLPFTQVNKIVEHAAAQGYQKIGVFAPDNDYGKAVIKAYKSRADSLGLETVNITRYPVSNSDISPIIREFTEYDARVEELNQMIRPLKEDLKSRPNDEELQAQIKELEARDTAGEPPYDAVLLPVGGDQAKAISNLLSFYDLDPEDVTRLGTGLWDDPSLAMEPNMAGGRFAAPSPDSRLSFENQYRRLYNTPPPRLATLAYDATALAVVLGRFNMDKGKDGPDLYKLRDITNPNGYAGIDGIFRFRPGGLIERGLAVLTFTQDKDIEILEPAPETFQSPQRF